MGNLLNFRIRIFLLFLLKLKIMIARLIRVRTLVLMDTRARYLATCLSKQPDASDFRRSNVGGDSRISFLSHR